LQTYTRAALLAVEDALAADEVLDYETIMAQELLLISIARFLPPPKYGRSRTQTRGTRRFQPCPSLPSFEAGGQESHQEQKEEER
jgi:hypothetical protein